VACGTARRRVRWPGGPMEDVIYIVLTIFIFAVLWLLVKGVERFER
jgi:hypothetical protein